MEVCKVISILRLWLAKVSNKVFMADRGNDSAETKVALVSLLEIQMVLDMKGGKIWVESVDIGCGARKRLRIL